jgi:hypothetical protein
MSALGHKQTSHSVSVMSALPNSGSLDATTMSALCQKRTHALRQAGPLFDQPVGGSGIVASASQSSGSR